MKRKNIMPNPWGENTAPIHFNGLSVNTLSAVPFIKLVNAALKEWIIMP